MLVCLGASQPAVLIEPNTEIMKKLFIIIVMSILLSSPHLVWAQKTLAKAVPVYAAAVKLSEFTDTVEALGSLKANENVSLASTVTELVTAVNFVDGQRVVKGDVLVQMDASEELAQLAEEQSRVNEAQRQVDRFKPLISRGSVSELAFDQSVGDLSAAKARLQAAQSRVNQRQIVAPFDGVVGLRNTSVGALVQPGVLVTTIDDDSSMKLDFSVPEVFLQTLKPGLKISATTSAYPDQVYVGEVASVGSRVDPSTRSIMVRARLDNAQRILKPGLLMRVVLQKSPRQAKVVQEEGIIANGKRNFVLLAVTNGGQTTAQRREVRLGARRKGEVEVLEGLEVGDLVITHGTLKAKDGSLVEVLAMEKNDEPLAELIKQYQDDSGSKPSSEQAVQKAPDGGAAQ